MILLWLLACGPATEPDPDAKPPAIEEAECCLGPKRWEAGEQGWQSWRVDSFELDPGQYNKITVSLTKGLKYRFEACGASEVVNVDLILYDGEGEIAVRDVTQDREPVIEWVALDSGTHHLVVYMRQTTTSEAGAVAYGWASLTGQPR